MRRLKMAVNAIQEKINERSLKMIVNEIQEKINELRNQQNSVQGTKCEVYSRVVGYLRPVSLWNDGKREEFKIRKTYSLSCFNK
jgi:anaerobic ribonucleoside-triphosphate reductase